MQIPVPYLQIQQITKKFKRFVALQDISFDIHPGEFICFLGPSGCGKTTLLRIIAGLERQDAGHIIQGGRDISYLPPNRRDFGIVFQSYALFPNLTATQNIAYGLQNKFMGRGKVRARVRELLELVGLTEFARKYPAQLSGGQQQRVALARALALSPGLLLLDEPLSALDARVRVALRHELMALQRRLGITTIMVTHDQEEALTVADRIVVMDHGVIRQIGTPQEIYQKPSTPFVANFVGEINFLPGQVRGSNAVEVHRIRLTTPPLNNGHHATGDVSVAFRPEDIRLVDIPESAPNVLTAKLEDLVFYGSFYRLNLSLHGSEPAAHLVAEASTHVAEKLNLAREKRVGDTLTIHLPVEQLRVYHG